MMGWLMILWFNLVGVQEVLNKYILDVWRAGCRVSVYRGRRIILSLLGRLISWNVNYVIPNLLHNLKGITILTSL